MAGVDPGDLRVLALTNLYPIPARPTFAPYNRQQFAALSHLHQVRVICPVPWPVVAREALRGRRVGSTHVNDDGLEVHTPTFMFPPRMMRHRYGEFFERSVSGVAKRLLERYRPHVILSSWAYPDGWAAVNLGKAAGIPVVIKVVGTDVRVVAAGQRRGPTAEALAAADAVIAVSEELRHRVVDLGVSPERVHVVPEGIDAERFTPGDRDSARRRLGLPSSEPLIVFVGNLLETKGTLDLVKACALLRDRGVPFQCRLVGQGKDARRTTSLIHSMNLADRVALVGARPHAELPDWYRACDVVALPSYSEGIPNVLREAIACERPFAATDVGGIPEIADASFSRLVRPGAIEAFADALQALWQASPRPATVRFRHANVRWVDSARLLSEQLQLAVEARAIANGNVLTVGVA